MVTRTPTRAERALLFFFANSFAETLQAVGILWAAFALTDSGVVVGVVNAFAYLPGVVVGVLYRNRADSGDSDRSLARTNRALVVGSTALTVVWLVAGAEWLLIAFFIAAQILLSVVKMLNKAYIGRFVRQRFSGAQARHVLERATSLGLVGGLVGGGLGGLLLELGSAGWLFALAALMYVVSLWAIRFTLREGVDPQRVDPAPAKASPAETSSGLTGSNRRLLWLVLVFSVPSSGALPYISTLMVPFSDVIAPGAGAFYAALTIATTLGGFVAGMALSAEKITIGHVLTFGLLASAALCVGLGAATWAPLVLLLVFLVAVVLTAHVISMQVLTNQAPAENEVGKFTVMRNCVAGLAKGGFSLVAGWIVDVGGPAQSWLVLAVVLVVFGVGWYFVDRKYEGVSIPS